MMRCFLFLLLMALYLMPLQAQYSLQISGAYGGACNGQIEVLTDPANDPHTFLWSDGQTSATVTNLCPEKYDVTVTDANGCSLELTGLIEIIDGCYIAQENFAVQINEYCGPTPDGSITIWPASRTNYNFLWENGWAENYRNQLDTGQYCVTITAPADPNCIRIECYSVGLDSSCLNLPPDTPVVSDGLIIVNEVSNGLMGAQEFVELLVLGDDSTCTLADIRNYIIDDNNGDFSAGNLAGSGIASGHIRFTNDEVWHYVPVGSLILIYNSADKNPRILLPDDPTDANNDNVYVLPDWSSYLEAQADRPSVSFPYTYPVGSPYGNPAWEYLLLYDGKDAMQVRYPDGDFCHGIVYGPGMDDGPGAVYISPLSGYRRVYYMSGRDDFRIGYLGHGGVETPGEANDVFNDGYITSLCQSHYPPEKKVLTSVVTDKVKTKVFPNPFQREFRIQMQATLARDIEIKVYDLLGRLVYRRDAQLEKGDNQYLVRLKEELGQGIYFVSVLSGKEILLNEKVSYLK
ncbi:MAG: T9SS type A sorting domain-containing protein [Bacteroidota bacterium]